MGKAKKRSKKFDYNKDRRKAWKKSKQMPTIRDSTVKEAWDSRKSVNQNFREMGLSSDPNKTLPIPKTKDLVYNSIDEVLAQEHSGKKSKPLPKSHVIEGLESEANAPQEKRLRLSQPEVSFCTYMLDRYGEDYKAMARDKKNYYQDTPKQIRRRIATFTGIPEHYQPYLQSKQKPTMDTS